MQAASRAANKALRPQATTAGGKSAAKTVFLVGFCHLTARAYGAWGKIEFVHPLAKIHIIRGLP